ncbi:MAG: Lsr2 family protein [Actinomycetales bacterium]|nr:Lsr2 family protein [Actinomycetales bacterium]
MATRTLTILTDDLDGSELPSGTSTTTFSLNGTNYAIDLGPANAKRLEEALAPFVSRARKSGSARRAASGGARRGRADSDRLGEIRAWATANGYQVGDRGRIKAEIVEAFDRAH